MESNFDFLENKEDEILKEIKSSESLFREGNYKPSISILGSIIERGLAYLINYELSGEKENDIRFHSLVEKNKHNFSWDDFSLLHEAKRLRNDASHYSNKKLKRADAIKVLRATHLVWKTYYQVTNNFKEAVYKESFQKIINEIKMEYRYLDLFFDNILIKKILKMEKQKNVFVKEKLKELFENKCWYFFDILDEITLVNNIRTQNFVEIPEEFKKYCIK